MKISSQTDQSLYCIPVGGWCLGLSMLGCYIVALDCGAAFAAFLIYSDHNYGSINDGAES